MDSRCAGERNVSFFDDAHPERLFPPDRRDVRSWQPFVGAGMSFTDLNNEDYFSDHPKRPPSFDALFRAQAQLSPEYFFRNLVPFACVALPEEWRLSAFTSGIVLEFFAGAILYFAHSRWQARRRDYSLWLRLIHRRATSL